MGVHIPSGIAAALAALMTIAVPSAGAQQAAAPAVAIDNDDIGGVVRGAKRSRGRCLGDRGNARSAGALHQDRRHRRSGPLRDPRSAESQLRRVGARLRPRRFAEGEERARQAAQPDRGAGPQRGGSREVLPGDLLVRDDEDPRGRDLRQQGRAEQRQDHRLSQRHEEQRLRRLPPARPALDPHDSEVPPGRGQDATKRPGCVASSPARPARTWSPSPPVSSAACRSSISATGPSAWRRANCRLQSRRGRRASSATSWSRSATGTTTSNICTI